METVREGAGRTMSASPVLLPLLTPVGVAREDGELTEIGEEVLERLLYAGEDKQRSAT